MSSVDFVLRAIVDGQTGLVHNAAMRAVQASPNENGAGERYARVITASVPFERIAEALEAQGIQARGSLWDMLRPLRGEPLEVAWAHPFGDDARSAFASCDQPDWLLAMALSLGVDHRTVIRSLIRVVERAGLGPLSPEGAERLDLARTWAEGGALPSEREWAPTTSLDVAVRTIELSCRAPHLAPFAADRIRTALHAAERTTDHLAISRRVTAALRNELPAPQ